MFSARSFELESGGGGREVHLTNNRHLWQTRVWNDLLPLAPGNHLRQRQDVPLLTLLPLPPGIDD